MSFSTPVDVSACTTARAARRVRACASSSRCGSSGAAPRRVDPHDLGAAPAGDLAHALAEHAVDADDHGVAGLDAG